MGEFQKWSVAEMEELQNHFRSPSRGVYTTFQRIHRINPQRPFSSVDRELRRLRQKGGFVRDAELAQKSLRVGYFDIETSNLDADFGMMLCWYIKPSGSKEYDHACITRDEIFDLSWDKRITTELLAAFDKYDVLYTHWGVDRRFDFPFVRTRAYKNNIEHLLPKKQSLFIRDTWPIARNKLRLSRNSLERIAMALNIRNIAKTFLDPDKLMRARYGSETDLKWIDHHCMRDVQLLERVHRKLEQLDSKPMRSV